MQSKNQTTIIATGYEIDCDNNMLFDIRFYLKYGKFNEYSNNHRNANDRNEVIYFTIV